MVKKTEEAEQACAVPAATQDPIAMYRDVISAAAAAVLLACGVDDANEDEAERLRKAAIKCHALGKALLEATQAVEVGMAQAEWVSADDRAPESGVYVLTCQAGDGPDDVRVLAWDDDRLHWVTDRAEDYCDRDDEELAPQFWQPIPLPPPPSAPGGT